MSWRLRVSAEASVDLQAVAAYLRVEAGPRAAAKYLRALRTRIGRLRDMPLVGVLAPEYGEGTRFVPCRRHLIFYECASDTVVVLRVLHHAQDRDTIMRGVQEEAAPFEASP